MPAFGDGIAHQDDAFVVRLGRWKLRVSIPVVCKKAEVGEELLLVGVPVAIRTLGLSALGLGWSCQRRSLRVKRECHCYQYKRCCNPQHCAHFHLTRSPRCFHSRPICRGTILRCRAAFPHCAPSCTSAFLCG